MKRLFFSLIIVLVTSCSKNKYVDQAPEVDTKEYSSEDLDFIREAAFIKPAARQLEWQKLEFTAFFHFGVNTFNNVEWGLGDESPNDFQPSNLDCEQWVKTCKDAGIKMAILTAKHHDGFCLWPSEYTDHDVASSSWRDGKGDVVREFVDACRKYGLKVGLYLSPWDRHESSYGTSEYNDFFTNQLNEVIEKYGPIDAFWFDGACAEGSNGKKQVYDWERYYKVIRTANIGTVISVMGPDIRWVGNEHGVARFSEWSVLPNKNFDKKDIQKKFEGFHFEGITDEDRSKLLLNRPVVGSTQDDLGSREKILMHKNLIWFPAECDVSIRPGWFYHKSQNRKVKSVKELLDIYYKSVGRNSVLLLNLPPDKRGLVHKIDRKRLAGLATVIDSTFSNNFIIDADVKVSSTLSETDQRSLVDNDFESIWGSQRDDKKPVIEVTFSSPVIVDRAMIQENIATGQRIERVSLQSYIDEEWSEVASVSTVGYKRLVRFLPIETKRFRFVFEQSRAEIEISEIGLYKAFKK